MENEIDANFTFSVNYPVTDAQRFRELFSSVTKFHFAEMNLTGPGGMLFISKNGDKTWLMFLRYEGDAGFHSVNSNYKGPSDMMLESYIQNRQADEKPLAEWVPLEEAERVAEHFFLHGEKAPWFTWYDDSQ